MDKSAYRVFFILFWGILLGSCLIMFLFFGYRFALQISYGVVVGIGALIIALFMSITRHATKTLEFPQSFIVKTDLTIFVALVMSPFIIHKIYHGTFQLSEERFIRETIGIIALILWLIIYSISKFLWKKSI